MSRRYASSRPAPYSYGSSKTISRIPAWIDSLAQPKQGRSVEVSLAAGAPAEAPTQGWQRLAVTTAEGDVHHGWWQRFGAFVLTVAATEPFAPPRPLVDPPSLATAVPAEAWRTGS